MNKRKISLIIALLFSVCFVYAQGTEIDVYIDNDSPSGYQTDITLHQPAAQPYTGSLSYTISANTPHLMRLEFDDVDICIESIKCTYPDHYEKCPISATLDVKCYNKNYSKESIAPTNDGKCYIFEYWDFYNNYCEYLEYLFKIY